MVTTHKKGFTLLYAVLIGSILLTIGTSIYNVSIKQVNFISLAGESVAAIYAAEAGFECAQYWNRKHPNGSAFSTTPPEKAIMCNGTKIGTYVDPNPGYDDDGDSNGDESFTIHQTIPGTGETSVIGGKGGTDVCNRELPLFDPESPDCLSIFYFELPDPSPGGRGSSSVDPITPCVIVYTREEQSASEGLYHLFTARAYNTCDLNDPRRLERALVNIKI